MDITPNQTLYVNNLNDKITKDELRRALYSVFSQYGAILDVVALKTEKMRGQAFIVFRDIASASTALRAMQKFNFYGKEMHVEYALGKSHAVMKEDGTWGREQGEKNSGNQQQQSKPKRVKMTVDAETNGNAKNDKKEEEEEEEDLPPNNILYLSNIPKETTEKVLIMLFNQYPGMKEVRLIPGRSDLAFVEYQDMDQATVAMKALQRFLLAPKYPLKITYAKK